MLPEEPKVKSLTADITKMDTIEPISKKFGEEKDNKVSSSITESFSEMSESVTEGSSEEVGTCSEEVEEEVSEIDRKTESKAPAVTIPQAHDKDLSPVEKTEDKAGAVTELQVQEKDLKPVEKVEDKSVEIKEQQKDSSPEKKSEATSIETDEKQQVKSHEVKSEGKIDKAVTHKQAQKVAEDVVTEALAGAMSSVGPTTSPTKCEEVEDTQKEVSQPSDAAAAVSSNDDGMVNVKSVSEDASP